VVPLTDPVPEQWSDDIAAGFFLIVGRETAAAVRRAYESQNALATYFRELVAERRAHPRDALLSALGAAEADEAMLSQDELLATCVLLLFAGHETTTTNASLGEMAEPATTRLM
jgi:cytochrome P450